MLNYAVCQDVQYEERMSPLSGGALRIMPTELRANKGTHDKQGGCAQLTSLKNFLTTCIFEKKSQKYKSVAICEFKS
jgi:hypothetical protein